MDQDRMALFDGTANDDTIVGTPGDDTIHGNGGNDAIDTNGGNDIVTGDDGDDFITIRHGQLDIDGGTGTDTLRLIQPGLNADGYEDGYYVDLRQSGTLILERDLFGGGFGYSRAATAA
jgi:Ca2+-binding RTX toxin-like protein